METGGLTRKAKSEINVTPLIDIVLVLLIVFIVMIPGLTKALAVTVPKPVTTPASTDTPDPENPPVVLTLLPGEQGTGYRCLLQSAEISMDEIPDRLVPVLKRQVRGLRKVFLKVDGEVPYQTAVDVMDRIRQASDRAKAETGGTADGGDAKVVISLVKPS